MSLFIAVLFFDIVFPFARLISIIIMLCCVGRQWKCDHVAKGGLFSFVFDVIVDIWFYLYIDSNYKCIRIKWCWGTTNKWTNAYHAFICYWIFQVNFSTLITLKRPAKIYTFLLTIFIYSLKTVKPHSGQEKTNKKNLTKKRKCMRYFAEKFRWDFCIETQINPQEYGHLLLRCLEQSI